MRRVLFDTNVVLDVLLRREPWVADAQAIWAAVDAGRLKAFLPASALTDIYYVASRLTDQERARAAVRICLEAFEIARVDRMILEQAQNFTGPDFEDNVQIACAVFEGLEGIVTRDTEGFADGTPSSPLALTGIELTRSLEPTTFM